MRTWQIIALSKNGWKGDVIDFYSTKRIALSVAKKLLRERGDEFESISIIADNGGELLDDTETYIKYPES